MTRKITPQRAIDRYLEERRPEVSKSTHRNYKYLLDRFADWCSREEIEYITNLDGFDVHEFKMERSAEVNQVTLHKNLCTLRTFIRHLEAWDVIEDGLADNMILPDLDDETRDRSIEPETARDILEYLDTYEHARKRHALFALLWDTGMRLGAARSLDVDHYHPDDRYLEIHHQPESDTPLKNGKNGEREVNLHRWTCDVLDDYIDVRRHSVTDDYGRDPLLTTMDGRPALSGLRTHITALTRPCHYKGTCPHGREQAECDAARRRVHAARCPSTVSPHDIRRSSITAWLNQGNRKELVGGRCDVSVKILDKHYDTRSEEEKRQLRKDAFDME